MVHDWGTKLDRKNYTKETHRQHRKDKYATRLNTDGKKMTRQQWKAQKKYYLDGVESNRRDYRAAKAAARRQMRVTNQRAAKTARINDWNTKRNQLMTDYFGDNRNQYRVRKMTRNDKEYDISHYYFTLDDIDRLLEQGKTEYFYPENTKYRGQSIPAFKFNIKKPTKFDYPNDDDQHTTYNTAMQAYEIFKAAQLFGRRKYHLNGTLKREYSKRKKAVSAEL